MWWTCRVDMSTVRLILSPVLCLQCAGWFTAPQKVAAAPHPYQPLTQMQHSLLSGSQPLSSRLRHQLWRWQPRCCPSAHIASARLLQQTLRQLPGCPP